MSLLAGAVVVEQQLMRQVHREQSSRSQRVADVTDAERVLAAPAMMVFELGKMLLVGGRREDALQEPGLWSLVSVQGSNHQSEHQAEENLPAGFESPLQLLLQQAA